MLQFGTTRWRLSMGSHTMRSILQTVRCYNHPDSEIVLKSLKIICLLLFVAGWHHSVVAVHGQPHNAQHLSNCPLVQPTWF
jgi:hypothetical protein